jgi:hypothetical protein
VINPVRLLFTPLLVGWALLPGAVCVAATTGPWMTEEAMRGAFIGKTLDGHYGNGVSWTEIYFPDGRLDYREKARTALGYWYFRDGNVFCTFYEPKSRPSMAGGCWNALKTSSNCYEFYLVGLEDRPARDESNPDFAVPRWNAQGWRKGEPSTCMEKPSV